MEKYWYESKTVWGFVGFTVFGIMNIFYPNPLFQTGIVTSLGWAGYGFRDNQD